MPAQRINTRGKTAPRAVFLLCEISHIPDARLVEEWYSGYCKFQQTKDSKQGRFPYRWSAGMGARSAAKS